MWRKGHYIGGLGSHPRCIEMIVFAVNVTKPANAMHSCYTAAAKHCLACELQHSVLDCFRSWKFIFTPASNLILAEFLTFSGKVIINAQRWKRWWLKLSITDGSDALQFGLKKETWALFMWMFSHNDVVGELQTISAWIIVSISGYVPVECFCHLMLCSG